MGRELRGYKMNLQKCLKRIVVSVLLSVLTNCLIVTYISFINSPFPRQTEWGGVVAGPQFYLSAVMRTAGNMGTPMKQEHFYQETSFTCGPATVRYVLHYFGLNVSEKELICIMDTTKQGSTLSSLKETIELFGFSSEGAVVNYAKLQELKMPVIAFVKGDHYIVLNRVTSDHLYCFDPDPLYGFLYIKKDVFLGAWDGVILKVNTKPIPLEGC